MKPCIRHAKSGASEEVSFFFFFVAHFQVNQRLTSRDGVNDKKREQELGILCRPEGHLEVFWADSEEHMGPLWCDILSKK